MQKSPFPLKNAKFSLDFVQKSPFLFENAKSSLDFVQKSAFPLKNAKSSLDFVQKSPFPLKNAKSSLDFVQKSPFLFENAKSSLDFVQKSPFPLKNAKFCEIKKHRQAFYLLENLTVFWVLPLPRNAGSRTRTGTRSPPSDFESDASAIPPRRHTFATKSLYHK